MAATTGKVRSNSIGIYIQNGAIDGTYAGDTLGDGTTGGGETGYVFELIACATSGSFSAQTEIIEATTKDNDGQREILIGGVTWSMAAEGLIQFNTSDSVRGALDLFDLWSDKTQVRVAWTTGQSGDYLYHGKAYITQLEETAGLNEVATYSITLEGDGAITKQAVDTGGLTFNNNDD